MSNDSILRILFSMRGKIYNSIINEENQSINICQAYTRVTGKKFSEISRDVPKIKYFIKPSIQHKGMDAIESLILINDLIDLYQGYYPLNFKTRLKNVINYIKNSF